MTAIRWSSRASADLVEIGDYIARRDPEAAARFVGELMDRVLVLADEPRSGRLVPEIGDESIRELILGNYRIVYRLAGGEAQVLTVFEGRHLLPSGRID
jgi:plasmid stabilization system protein ParE